MRYFILRNGLSFAKCAVVLPIVLTFLPNARTAETKTTTAAKMNVVLLDDGTLERQFEGKTRRNDWDTWRRRLPTFLELLDRFVARFQPASADQIDSEDTLFALEVKAALPPDRIDAFVASELERIWKTTSRPSVVLARGSAGSDQLRLVFQDGRDYPPRDAAKFLRVFREIAPPIAHSRITRSFGPFQPPPTMVFDPRADSLFLPADLPERGKRRWALLEEETYMLPHYVLHHLAVLNGAVTTHEATFYTESKLEAGTTLVVDVILAPKSLQGKLNSVISEYRGMEKTQYVTISDFKNDPKKYISQGGYLRLVGPTATEFVSRHLPAKLQSTQALSALKDTGAKVNLFTADYIGAYQGLKSAQETGFTKKNLTLTSFDVTSGGNFLSLPIPGGTAAQFALRHKDMVKLGKGIQAFGGRVIATQGTINPSLLYALRQSGVEFTRVDTTKQGGGLSLPWGGVSGEFITPRVLDDAARKVAATTSSSGMNFSHCPTTVGGLLKSLDAPFQNKQARGGIDFREGNVYFLDLSGHVRQEAKTAMEGARGGQESVEIAGQTKGVARIRLRLAPLSKSPESLQMMQLDFRNPRNGNLPFAAPRFASSRAEEDSRTEGGWSFEPVRIEGLQNLHSDKQTRGKKKIMIAPAETGNALQYGAVAFPETPASAEEHLPSHVFVKMESRFQPDLDAGKNGGLIWTLGHGVSIEFDSKGFPKTISEPSGHTVTYSREGSRMCGQESSDGRTLRVTRADGRPTGATLDGKEVATYHHEKGRLSAVSVEQSLFQFAYNETGDLNRIASNSWCLDLLHDENRQVTAASADDQGVRVEYMKGSNVIRIHKDNHSTAWYFTPRKKLAGVVMADRVILWTRSVEGRILQVALGRQETVSDISAKVIVEETIGVRSPSL